MCSPRGILSTMTTFAFGFEAELCDLYKQIYILFIHCFDEMSTTWRLISHPIPIQSWSNLSHGIN